MSATRALSMLYVHLLDGYEKCFPLSIATGRNAGSYLRMGEASRR